MASAQSIGVGRSVLLVEDESLVSMLAEDILLDAGFTVVLAMRLAEAMELASTASIDLAVLDVNLGGGDTSFPVAAILQQRGIPFLFASGYDLNGIEQTFRTHARIEKPYTPYRLLTAAAEVLARGNSAHQD